MLASPCRPRPAWLERAAVVLGVQRVPLQSLAEPANRARGMEYGRGAVYFLCSAPLMKPG